MLQLLYNRSCSRYKTQHIRRKGPNIPIQPPTPTGMGVEREKNSPDRRRCRLSGDSPLDNCRWLAIGACVLRPATPAQLLPINPICLPPIPLLVATGHIKVRTQRYNIHRRT
ncbi:hypothetical protein SLA2020_279550 [Shorea laevis]